MVEPERLRETRGRHLRKAMAYRPVALCRQPDDPCRMPPRSPLEAAIPREIGADPAKMSTRSSRVERQSHAVALLRGCGRWSIDAAADNPGPDSVAPHVVQTIRLHLLRRAA